MDLEMRSIIGLKPMKSSEVVKIYLALDGYEPFGRHFNEVLEVTQLESERLRDLLDKYHFYFTRVGDTGRYILNRRHYEQSDFAQVVDSIERRNVRFAVAKFTPIFIVGLVICSSAIGFMLSSIVNKHGGYF